MKPITEQRRQELIADCQKEIGTLMLWLECGPLRDRSKTESELLRQQIALASLTAVRAGWGLRSLQEDCYGSWLTTEPREQAYLDCQPHKYENVGLYTAPPVPVIKLPDDHKIDGVGSLAYASGYEDGHKDAIELVKRLNGLK